MRTPAAMDPAGRVRGRQPAGAAKPFNHLLLLMGLLPAAGAEHHLFGLAYNHAALLREGAGCPHEAEVCADQVRVIRIVERAVFDQAPASTAAAITIPTAIVAAPLNMSRMTAPKKKRPGEITQPGRGGCRSSGGDN